MADDHTTSPELWDKLRQIRWEHLADLPTEVADVMLEAADFVEVAMSQAQSPSTSIMLEMAEADEEQKLWERRFAALYHSGSLPSWRTADTHGSWGLRDFLAYSAKICGFKFPPEKEQSND